MVFTPTTHGFPDAGDPLSGLEPVFAELFQCVIAHRRLDPFIHITCKLLVERFTLESLQYFSDWLEINRVNLWALDLSCNCVACSDWSQLVPVLLQLQKQARWISLGDNPLPPLDTVTNELDLIVETKIISLAVSSLDLFYIPKFWRRLAKKFDQEAYGVPKGYAPGGPSHSWHPDAFCQ